MLLAAQMTQRGGICSDSPRITYTPAAGRERGDAGPRQLPALGRVGKARGGEAAAGGGCRHPLPPGETGPNNPAAGVGWARTASSKRLRKLPAEVRAHTSRKAAGLSSLPLSPQTLPRVPSPL